MRASYIQDPEQWASGFNYSVPVQVRFGDTDMYGHLNNTYNFTYFEFARIEFFKHIGLMGDWLDPKGKTIPVVADLQCDYVKQVYFDEKLLVHVKIASIGNSSVDIHYHGTNEKGETVFTGRGTVVQINKESGKGSPWTEEEKTLFLSN